MDLYLIRNSLANSAELPNWLLRECVTYGLQEDFQAVKVTAREGSRD